ncbi:MAG: RusA family crossover junction endodeoxyribonuclease [Enterococcus faecalis]|nr:RusA family crossover junction endodeoxyribonuclease [Enterococcus faecalis]
MSKYLISFFVPGKPITEGSTRYLGVRGGKPIITHDNPELSAWRQKVAQVAVLYARQAGWSLPLDEPVIVGATFTLKQPKQPRWSEAATKPDLDKLQRAIGDALGAKGSVLREDSRICEWQAAKQYGDKPGVHITVSRHWLKTKNQLEEAEGRK